MFEITTRRLRLIPLPLEYLRLLAQDRPVLERGLGLAESGEPMDADLREALEKDILPGVTAHPGAYEWYTEWQIILKSEQSIIGGFCFKGRPDRQGEVEIGYGMQPAYRNQGYMTEALGAAIDWAMSQPGVSRVRAETERANLPSLRVLEKSGMVPSAGEARSKAMIWRTHQQYKGSPPLNQSPDTDHGDRL